RDRPRPAHAARARSHRRQPPPHRRRCRDPRDPAPMSAALRRGLTPALVLAAATSMWSATQPADACGCGVAIEAEVNDETGLVVDKPGSEEIILSLDLSSDSDERAAVILPVPGVPEVAAIDKGDPLAYLDEA